MMSDRQVRPCKPLQMNLHKQVDHAMGQQPMPFVDEMWSSPFMPEHQSSPLDSVATASLPSPNDRGEMLQCNYCDYKAYKKYRLRAHMMKHTGERPYSCSYCPYRSSDRTALKNHIRRHTGEKPFVCPYCDYSAARKFTLQNHLLTHK